MKQKLYKGGQCKKKDCKYKSRVGSMRGACNYLSMTGHSRGCDPANCDKYKKEKRSKKECRELQKKSLNAWGL